MGGGQVDLRAISHQNQPYLGLHKLCLCPPTSSRPQSSDDEDSVDELAQNLGSRWTMGGSNDEQEGSGLDYLRCTCDRAEEGDLDEAWDALNEARQLRAPRTKLKQVEQYLATLRD